MNTLGRKRNEILNPRVRGKGDIMDVDIADACEEYTKLFGANKNVARANSLLIDGLKPVQRRVLYDMYDLKIYGRSKPKKTTSISGDTMGRFHPHGDGSITTTIVNMNQEWCWVCPYLVPFSSFGGIRGDQAAMERYTETKLSDFAMDCFFSDFDKANMPKHPSYTEDDMEPEYLPAKYPVVLINPQLSGIGYGQAGNIPPFNFSEVVKATIKLMDDPDAKIRLIPDSPTGCDIVDTGLFNELNETGKSKFTLRANYDIDYMNNIITVKSIPLHSTTESIQKKLIAMHRAGKFPELVDFEERTKRSNVDFDIILTQDADPDKVIEKIMKSNVGMKKTYAAELRVVHDYKAQVHSPKDILLKWIEYRRDCVRSVFNEKIISTMEDIHLTEAMIIMSEDDNFRYAAEQGISSKSRAELEERLMKKLGVTTMQASKIAGMAIVDSVKDRKDEFVANLKKYKTNLEYYEKVLRDTDGVNSVIKEELLEGNKKWGKPRQSKIIKVGKEKENIPDTKHLIGISLDGYIKKLSLDEYVSIGVVGKSSKIFTIAISNRDNLLLFDSTGYATRVSVSALPDMKFKDCGVRISRYFKTQGTVVSMVKESDVKDHPSSNIVFVTKKGYGKKSSIKEFSKIKVSTMAIGLEDGDELVSAIPSLDGDDFIVYTNFGDGIRLATDDFKQYKKTARGLRLLSLRKEEEVVGIDLLYAERKYLLYITSSGRVKLTESKYFPVMKRKQEPLTLISLNKGEKLLGVVGVQKTDTLVAYRKKSDPEELDVDSIPVTTRVAEPKKMVKTPKGDEVVAYQVVNKK